MEGCGFEGSYIVSKQLIPLVEHLFVVGFQTPSPQRWGPESSGLAVGVDRLSFGWDRNGQFYD